MMRTRTTLLAAAIAGALAAGPAWSQGAATPGGASSSAGTAGGAAAPGTTANPGGRTASADSRPAGKSDLARADRQFVMDAAEAGMAEVRAGQLAAQKASSPAVREFAQRMVDDHTKANAELMKLASARNVTPPNGPDRKHRAAMEKLEKMSGSDFDRAYMKQQVEDHEKTVSLFEKQAKNGKDDELKQWASKMLPALREHLQMARSDMGAQTRRGDSGSSASSSTSGHGGASTAGASSPGASTSGASAAGGSTPGSTMSSRPSGSSSGTTAASGAGTQGSGAGSTQGSGTSSTPGAPPSGMQR